MRTLFAALLLFPLPALADNLTVGAGATSETATLSTADTQKFNEWVQDAYKCTPQPNCTPFTLAQSRSAWAIATLQGSVDNANRYHNVKAMSEAVAGVPPITPVMSAGKKK